MSLDKWIRVHADHETHEWLERIQIAEKQKFSYLKKRRKEVIAADVVKVGIAEFIKLHNLNIKL